MAYNLKEAWKIFMGPPKWRLKNNKIILYLKTTILKEVEILDNKRLKMGNLKKNSRLKKIFLGGWTIFKKGPSIYD